MDTKINRKIKCLVYEDDKEPNCGQKVAIESYIDGLVGKEMDVDYIYAPASKYAIGDRVFNSIRKDGLILWAHSGN